MIRVRALVAYAAPLCAALGISMAMPPVAVSATPDEPYCVITIGMPELDCYQSERALKNAYTSAATTPVAILYNWINYSLDSRAGYIQVNKPGGPCTTTTGDVEAFVDDLSYYVYPNSGINVNNTVSSLSTFTASHCDLKLYDGFYRTGTASDWIDRCTHLDGSGAGDCSSGNWYDRASSFAIS